MELIIDLIIIVPLVAMILACIIFGIREINHDNFYDNRKARDLRIRQLERELELKPLTGSACRIWGEKP